ncbi:putative RDD family membrane protein YckC [Pedobacter sp. AK013]|uniref:RDD family protein n=1 Tax=Pedobacter sp. AK013 TaxID=2723071 RepID=UPI00160DA634|nr:RDD family protein [Pedobacter sp. AK013]MBB6238942.1 putative RDD family membrane protein YckC [Pedobacter sp. AK013]
MKKNLIIAVVLGLTFAFYSFQYIRYLIELYSVIKRSDGTINFSWAEYVSPILLILNLVGLMQFVLSKYERSGILRTFLQFNILLALIFHIFNAYRKIFPNLEPLEHANGPLGILDFIGYAYLIFEIYALITLQNSLIPVLRSQEDGSFTFDDVNKPNRFLHRLFDLLSIMMIYYFYLKIGSYYRIRFDENRNYLVFFETKAYLPLTLFGFLYYLIFEGIFNTSIGKTIMGNMVVNNVAEKPSIIQRIGRTFARIIPFDALSYLFGERGWHDRIANTYVVKAMKKSPNNTPKELG